MKKLLDKIRRSGSRNNSGMTLVEVLVASAIFGILASMVAFLYTSSLHNQLNTEKWNNQTDAQTAYLAEHRNDSSTEFMDNAVGGGATQYKLKITFGDGTTIQSNDVDMYYVQTQHPTNDGNQIPTDEDIHIKFFRVS